MGERNGKLPLRELAQDAAYQSYTSRLTELWSLPKPAQGLNTYNNNNNNNNVTVLGNPKDNHDMSASVFVVQFNGFMSLTS